MRRIFELNHTPTGIYALFLTALPFFLIIGIYFPYAYYRVAQEPSFEQMPTVDMLLDGVKRSFIPDHDGNIRFLTDTLATGQRFGISAALLIFPIFLGLYMGVLPWFEIVFRRFIEMLDKLNPLTLVPVVFLFCGTGELFKVVLICVGIFPQIALDTYNAARLIPREQIIGAQTLGANGLKICYRVVLPQIIPRVLEVIELSIKPMISYLIAAEVMNASRGMGYRIYLAQRKNDMSFIIPYVFEMALFGFFLVKCIQVVRIWQYPWYGKE